MADEKTIRKLRKKLDTAIAKRKGEDALAILGELMEADPSSPRWPHKRGDLYRKARRRAKAIDAYATAVDLYAAQGFIARAVAMAKTVLNLDPSRIDILERVDPQAAQMMHRKQRPRSASGMMAAVVVPGPAAPRPIARHPAVIPDSNAPPMHHPAVIPDSNAPLHHPAIIPDDVSAQYAARTVDMPPLVIPDAPPLPPLPVLAPHAPSPTAQRQRLSLDDLSLPPPPLRMPISQGDSEPIELEVLGDISIPAPPRAPDFSEGAFATAEELVIAPDVQPGETRFSNIPRARGGLSLDLTELELEPRRLAAPPSEPAQEEPGETTVAELSKLPLFPLFAELPRQALGQLVRGAEVLEFEDGEAVVRKGEESDALYGIVDGSVAIIAEQNLQITLAEGDVFGEACLLPGERRHADVIVVGHLTVLKIGRDLLNQMLTLYPQLAEILLELLTRRLLGNLLQSSPLFLEFDAHGRQELAGLFEIRRAPQGIVLAEAGKRVDGLYINLTGGLEITYADGRPFEHMRAGTMFGHEGMITRQPSQIGVRALSNMIILRLPAEAFNTLVMQYPAILAKLSELSVDPVAKVCF